MELSPRIYRLFVRPKWFGYRYISNNIGKVIDLTDKTVLDFGCGIGSNTFLFPNSHYIGIDCNKVRIEYARRRYPKHQFITVSGNTLPLSDRTIDVILVLSVFHHIPSHEFDHLLKEFSRVLKPEGCILAIEPCLFKKTFISNWFMRLIDCGKYIRTEKEYTKLLQQNQYKTKVIMRYKQLILYNKIMINAIPYRKK